MHSLSLLSFSVLSATALASTPFGYTGETGPLLWAELDPAFEKCATGDRQSPINIPSTLQTIALTPANVNYPDILDNVTLENTGHGIEFIPPADVNVTINIDGKHFQWAQAHFHTPSEHRFEDEHFPMEVHFVHKETNNGSQAAVIGLFFEMDYTVPQGLMNSICPNLDKVKGSGNETTINGVNLRQINNAVHSAPLFTYAGSLTTPPCAEVVTFYIVKRPIPLSVGQYRRMKSIMKFNARYTQADIGKNSTNLLEQASTNLCSLKKFKF